MRRLYRSTNEKIIGGVFGGLGKLLDWDPNQIRLLAVIIAVFTGVAPMLISYIIAWILLPKDMTV
jgi:phage shock protein C